MAYIDTSTPEDEQQLSQVQPGQLSAGSGLASNTAAPSAIGSGPQAASSFTAKPTSSGEWTNLNSYLNANQDQSAGMGQNIANTVGQTAQTAENDLNNVITGFQNQAPFQQINSTTNQIVDNAFSNPSQYAPQTNNGISTPANITTPETYLNNNWGITPTNSDVTQYAPTTGPSWSNVQTDYQNANQQLQQTQNESGRDLLLQNQYGSNGQQYNQGEQSFDQLLLEQNPANSAALNSVYNQYAPNELIAAPSTTNTAQNAAAQAGESQDIYNALQNSQNFVNTAQTAATGFQNQANADLLNQIGGLKTNINNEISADQANYNNQYNNMQAALASGTLTQAQTQALGMFSDFTGPMGTPGGLNGGTEIHDYLVNPLSYLSENTNPYASTSPGQAANAASTAQDWGNFEGLQALLAADINSSQANALSNLNASGLTGTQAQAQAAQQLIQPAYNFDNGNFTTAVNQQNADYNTGVLKQVQNFINSIDSGTPADQAAQTESEWMNAQGINNVLNMLPN